jgi:hypothetical protein
MLFIFQRARLSIVSLPIESQGPIPLNDNPANLF